MCLPACSLQCCLGLPGQSEQVLTSMADRSLTPTSRDLLSGKFEEYPVPKAMGKIEAPIPPDHLIYDYMYEVSS